MGLALAIWLKVSNSICWDSVCSEQSWMSRVYIWLCEYHFFGLSRPLLPSIRPIWIHHFPSLLPYLFADFCWHWAHRMWKFQIMCLSPQLDWLLHQRQEPRHLNFPSFKSLMLVADYFELCFWACGRIVPPDPLRPSGWFCMSVICANPGPEKLIVRRRPSHPLGYFLGWPAM